MMLPRLAIRFIVLSRGQVRFPIMGDDWQQTGEGLAKFAEVLPQLLRSIVGRGGTLPTYIGSDRGPGIYNTGNGMIVNKYKDALESISLKPFAEYDANWQPADLADVWPHETVAAWVRRYFRRHPFKKVRKCLPLDTRGWILAAMACALTVTEDDHATHV